MILLSAVLELNSYCSLFSLCNFLKKIIYNYQMIQYLIKYINNRLKLLILQKRVRE